MINPGEPPIAPAPKTLGDIADALSTNQSLSLDALVGALSDREGKAFLFLSAFPADADKTQNLWIKTLLHAFETASSKGTHGPAVTIMEHLPLDMRLTARYLMARNRFVNLVVCPGAWGGGPAESPRSTIPVALTRMPQLAETGLVAAIAHTGETGRSLKAFRGSLCPRYLIEVTRLRRLPPSLPPSLPVSFSSLLWLALACLRL